jgi:hypothetical protein
MAVVTSATDGGLLTPLRECAIAGANAQNGTNPQEDEEHAHAQPQGRHGSRFRVLACGRSIRHVHPDSAGCALGSYSPKATVLKPTLPRTYDRAGVFRGSETISDSPRRSRGVSRSRSHRPPCCG